MYILKNALYYKNKIIIGLAKKGFLMKTTKFSLLFLLGIISFAFSYPDVSDKLTKNLQGIHLNTNLSLFNSYDGEYKFDFFSTHIGFGYENFFVDNMSLGISPYVGFTKFQRNENLLSISILTKLNYYFSSKELIPYISAGLGFGYDNTNSKYLDRNLFSIYPNLNLGVLYELKDQFYLDANISVPTFVGLEIDDSDTHFGLVDISTHLFFGLRYFY